MLIGDEQLFKWYKELKLTLLLVEQELANRDEQKIRNGEHVIRYFRRND